MCDGSPEPCHLFIPKKFINSEFSSAAISKFKSYLLMYAFTAEVLLEVIIKTLSSGFEYMYFSNDLNDKPSAKYASIPVVIIFAAGFELEISGNKTTSNTSSFL